MSSIAASINAAVPEPVRAALAPIVDREALPKRFGVLTPAVTMGDIIARRLASAGMTVAAD